MVGKIIMASTKITLKPDNPPAVCMPKRDAKPLTILVIKPAPKTPYIIEGIEANISTITKNTPLNGFGIILEINKAVRTPIGALINTAKNTTIKVFSITKPMP